MPDAFALTEPVPHADSIPSLAAVEAALREVAERAPGVAELRQIGCSRGGRPILALRVGEPSAPAGVVYGGPHSNELIGSLTIQWLAGALADDADLRHGLQWHLVPTVDPDAYLMNESWLHEPSSLRAYHSGFYRPASAEYTDWCFPVSHEDLVCDRPWPETLALKSLLDDTKPVFCYALHNAEYGGAFFVTLGQVSSTAAEELSVLPGRIGLPLEESQIELPIAESLSRGVFRMDAVSAFYDVLKAAGHPAPASAWPMGEHAGHYAERVFGTTTLVTEVPYWRDERAGDHAPSGRSMGEVATDCIQLLQSGTEELEAALATTGESDPASSPSPLVRAVADMVPSLRRLGLQQQQGLLGSAAADQPATIADEFSRGDGLRSILQRGRGMLLRHLRTTGARPEVLQRLQQSFDAEVVALESSGARPVPLRDLVRVQAAAGLVVARDATTARDAG